MPNRSHDVVSRAPTTLPQEAMEKKFNGAITLQDLLRICIPWDDPPLEGNTVELKHEEIRYLLSKISSSETCEAAARTLKITFHDFFMDPVSLKRWRMPKKTGFLKKDVPDNLADTGFDIDTQIPIDTTTFDKFNQKVVVELELELTESMKRTADVYRGSDSDNDEGTPAKRI
ncbi:hypothetical protein PM082_024981 [Marasmius tenuissimus]|nr:hypothetical protein PM082_024981 [Marasmius tenuissimus]